MVVCDPLAPILAGFFSLRQSDCRVQGEALPAAAAWGLGPAGLWQQLSLLENKALLCLTTRLGEPGRVDVAEPTHDVAQGVFQMQNGSHTRLYNS